MVADSDGVPLATFQVGNAAAGVDGAAAEKPLFFIRDDGGVRVHVRLAMPWNQSLVGGAVHRRNHLIRRARSWNEAKDRPTAESLIKESISESQYHQMVPLRLSNFPQKIWDFPFS